MCFGTYYCNYCSYVTIMSVMFIENYYFNDLFRQLLCQLFCFVSVMSIMTIMSNYVTLLQICVFQTIISIILFCFCYVNYGNYVRLCTLLHLFVFQSIISIICFDFYYFNSLFCVILCQLCQLYSLDIIRISGIIAIIYHCSFQHSKVAYGARNWCYFP